MVGYNFGSSYRLQRYPARELSLLELFWLCEIHHDSSIGRSTPSQSNFSQGPSQLLIEQDHEVRYRCSGGTSDNCRDVQRTTVRISYKKVLISTLCKRSELYLTGLPRLKYILFPPTGSRFHSKSTRVFRPPISYRFACPIPLQHIHRITSIHNTDGYDFH